MFRVGLYARVSTHDQQTLPLQMRAMREYAAKRGWTIAVQIKEVGSGAAERELREKLLAAARRREIDVVLVWRLDRWGRSLVDLVVTLKELAELGVAFVSLTEALDLTTPTGRAMAGLAIGVCRLRTRNPPRADPRGHCRSAAAGKASRPARDCRKTGRPDPETSPCRRQQSRDRPPPRYRPHVGSAYPRRKESTMSSPSIEFHKIWIDQCAATEDIRESFGLENALDYLIGEKLFTFLMASEQDPQFAAEVPAFVDEIRRIFTPAEIRTYLDHLERTKFLAPLDPVLDIEDPDDEIEDEPWHENPVMGAEELLRFSRVRQLLQ